MKRIRAMLFAGLAACMVLTACGNKEAADKAAADQAAADKAAADKAAADKAAADKAAADKAAADKAAADKAAADQAAADKAAADKAAADKAAADKAAADKAAADQAAADKAAADEKAHAGALPADLVLMKSELAQTLSQIDTTIAKLEVLSVATDIKQPSKDAVAAIDTLDTSCQAVKKRAQDMRDRGASYFDAWEAQLKTISTPEVAEIAGKRRDELAADYTDVLTSMQESRAAFDPFWTQMQSIKTAVDDGLTPDGQKNLVDQVKSLKEMAATLRSRVEATSAKLNQVSVIYTTR